MFARIHLDAEVEDIDGTIKDVGIEITSSYQDSAETVRIKDESTGRTYTFGAETIYRAIRAAASLTSAEPLD